MPGMIEQQQGLSTQRVPQPTIADRYSDLLDLLDRHQRQSLVVRLTVGYYEGWVPSRSEIADVVAVTLNVMSVKESLERQRSRNTGGRPPSIAYGLLTEASRAK